MDPGRACGERLCGCARSCRIECNKSKISAVEMTCPNLHSSLAQCLSPAGSALPSWRQLALGNAGATVDGIGVRQNKLVRRERAGIAPVGRPPQRRLPTGRFGITSIGGAVDGKEIAHSQAKSDAGALPASTLQPRSQVLVYNLTRRAIQGILVLRPDIVHLTRRISSRTLSSAHGPVRCSPPDQRKIIAERRRASCMMCKIVTAARDQ